MKPGHLQQNCQNTTLWTRKLCEIPNDNPLRVSVDCVTHIIDLPIRIQSVFIHYQPESESFVEHRYNEIGKKIMLIILYAIALKKNAYTPGQWYVFFYGTKTVEMSRYYENIEKQFSSLYSILQKDQIQGRIYDLLGVPNYCGKINKKQLYNMYKIENSTNNRFDNLDVQVQKTQLTNDTAKGYSTESYKFFKSKSEESGSNRNRKVDSFKIEKEPERSGKEMTGKKSFLIPKFDDESSELDTEFDTGFLSPTHDISSPSSEEFPETPNPCWSTINSSLKGNDENTQAISSSPTGQRVHNTRHNILFKSKSAEESNPNRKVDCSKIEKKSDRFNEETIGKQSCLIHESDDQSSELKEDWKIKKSSIKYSGNTEKSGTPIHTRAEGDYNAVKKSHCDPRSAETPKTLRENSSQFHVPLEQKRTNLKKPSSVSTASSKKKVEFKEENEYFFIKERNSRDNSNDEDVAKREAVRKINNRSNNREGGFVTDVLSPVQFPSSGSHLQSQNILSTVNTTTTGNEIQNDDCFLAFEDNSSNDNDNSLDTGFLSSPSSEVFPEIPSPRRSTLSSSLKGNGGDDKYEYQSSSSSVQRVFSKGPKQKKIKLDLDEHVSSELSKDFSSLIFNDQKCKDNSGAYFNEVERPSTVYNRIVSLRHSKSEFFVNQGTSNPSLAESDDEIQSQASVMTEFFSTSVMVDLRIPGALDCVKNQYNKMLDSFTSQLPFLSRPRRPKDIFNMVPTNNTQLSHQRNPTPNPQVESSAILGDRQDLVSVTKKISHQKEREEIRSINDNGKPLETSCDTKRQPTRNANTQLNSKESISNFLITTKDTVGNSKYHNIRLEKGCEGENCDKFSAESPRMDEEQGCPLLASSERNRIEKILDIGDAYQTANSEIPQDTPLDESSQLPATRQGSMRSSELLCDENDIENCVVEEQKSPLRSNARKHNGDLAWKLSMRHISELFFNDPHVSTKYKEGSLSCSAASCGTSSKSNLVSSVAHNSEEVKLNPPENVEVKTPDDEFSDENDVMSVLSTNSYTTSPMPQSKSYSGSSLHQNSPTKNLRGNVHCSIQNESARISQIYDIQTPSRFAEMEQCKSTNQIPNTSVDCHYFKSSVANSPISDHVSQRGNNQRGYPLSELHIDKNNCIRSEDSLCLSPAFSQRKILRSPNRNSLTRLSTTHSSLLISKNNGQEAIEGVRMELQESSQKIEKSNSSKQLRTSCVSSNVIMKSGASGSYTSEYDFLIEEDKNDLPIVFHR